MQAAGSPSLVDRMIGFARLDVPTIEDVEHDTNATSQALVVVVLAAVAAAIGTLGGEEGIARGIIFGGVSAIIGWIVFSVIAYFVGATLFATPQTSATIGQVLRVIGFAQTPKLIFVLGFIPLIGWIAWVVGWIWFVVVAIVAIRQAFEFTTERAIGTAIVAFIVELVIQVILAVLIGIQIAIFRAIF